MGPDIVTPDEHHISSISLYHYLDVTAPNAVYRMIFINSDPPLAGLSVARQIAMVTYRTAKGYEGKFGRGKDSAGVFQAKNYLSYQVHTCDIIQPLPVSGVKI